MKIKINSIKVSKTIKKNHFPEFTEIQPKGFFGWIWLMWKNNVQFRINILKKYNRFIHCLIQDNKKDIHRLTTLTYEYQQHHLQKQL